MSFERVKRHSQFSQPRLLDKVLLRPRLSLSILAGLITFFILPHDVQVLERFLLAWNVCAWGYVSSLLLLMWLAPPQHIRNVALVQDEDAGKVLAFVCLASIASLIAISLQLTLVSHMSGWLKVPPLLLTFFTLTGAWLLVPTAFAIHYAHLFYQQSGDNPALLFSEPIPEPIYSDFLYFSFTIAVASQTADVGVGNSQMRRVVLIQSILSFVFNLAILGLSINIGASLLV